MRASPTAGGMGGLPDESLAGLVAQGDDGAFEALYRRYRDGVLALCRAMLRDPHDAEEATQAAMLGAYRALARGERPRAVRAWLAAIARNECRDLQRRRPATVPLSGEVAAPAEGPAEQVEHRERIAELSRDLADLPRGQRTALVLRGLGGMRHAEIARVVGGTENAARNLVHDARTSLGEFEEGRALGCAQVRERIEAGDGRALRARRIRAHLRVCDGCRAAVAARRGGLGALLPAPLVAAVRGLLGAGHAGVPIAGGAAIASLAAIGALVLPGPWAGDPGTGPDGAAAASAASPIVAARATTAPVAARAGRDGRRPVTRRAGTRHVPAAAPAQSPAPAPALVTPGSTVPEPGATAGTTRPATVPASASVAVPRVSTPAVTTPAVITPVATVPPVTIPQVTVPPVAVPSVTVPSVAVPPVTIPSVRVGPVTTPRVTVPPVTTPVITTPPLVVEAPSAVTTPRVGPVPPVTVPVPLGGGPPIALP